jgi:hypothetical protein
MRLLLLAILLLAILLLLLLLLSGSPLPCLLQQHLCSWSAQHA